MDILSFLSDLPVILGAHVSTILGLIFMDVVIGIALAVRLGVFEWREVAAFYQNNVLPYVMGYLAVAGGTLFIAPELLPGDVGDALALIGPWLGFGAIASQLVFGSLLPNAKVLFLGRFYYDADDDLGTPIVG